MGLYDIIDEITERQVTKTETGDNRIWGVMVGIVAKNYDPNSAAAGGTSSGTDAMDGRVCVTIPTRDKDANELRWARVAMPSGVLSVTPLACPVMTRICYFSPFSRKW